MRRWYFRNRFFNRSHGCLYSVEDGIIYHHHYKADKKVSDFNNKVVHHEPLKALEDATWPMTITWVLENHPRTINSIPNETYKQILEDLASETMVFST